MNLPRIIDFHFEELPLVVDLGVAAGLLDGVASINVWGYDDWSVSGVSLLGYKNHTAVHVPISITEHGQIYSAILHQLENGEFKKQIDAQIKRELAEAV